jgi:hypothetical protein
VQVVVSLLHYGLLELFEADRLMDKAGPSPARFDIVEVGSLASLGVSWPTGELIHDSSMSMGISLHSLFPLDLLELVEAGGLGLVGRVTV